MARSHRSWRLRQLWKRTNLFSLVTLRRARGSGTVLGIMLIMVISMMLTAALLAGRLFVCHQQAQMAADTSALAASAADNGFIAGQSACIVASHCAELNHATLTRCTKDIDADDMKVTVSYATHVPLMLTLTVSSRAGPIPCQ
jgi:secretion/DNA translocation related TadE-like protein